jgi:hypothetical protein
MGAGKLHIIPKPQTLEKKRLCAEECSRTSKALERSCSAHLKN